jgi:hypothetical protein
MIPLTRRPGDLQAYKVIVEPGERQHDQQSHEGYEWMYVLNGRLRLMNHSSQSAARRPAT